MGGETKPTESLQEVCIQSNFIQAYREVTHAHGVLEKPLEAGGPAGHALLPVLPAAACSWKTAITGQAAVAAASLQLDATVVCRMGKTRGKVKMKGNPDGVISPP